MPSDMILKIAIPSPLRQNFDYLPPENFAGSDIQVGMRALVPFGRRELVGIIVEVTNITNVNTVKLKKAITILDQEPLLPQTIINLISWTANYYHHSLGDTFANAIPNLLRKKTCNKKLEYNQILTKIKQKTHKKTNINERFDPEELRPILNKYQTKAVSAIISTDYFQPFLLHGITGSGKTEVYLNTIEKIIAEQKQALVLVPEINLTPQTVTRFEKRFPVKIAVLHSRKTDKERLIAWMAAKNGEAAIIIGTRSAIFTPLKNPGIIILDEEHDLSFKQQSGLRYSARDLAIIRAKLENIPIILGSATPSFESLNNVKRDRYKLLPLPKRAGNAIPPKFSIVDMRAQKVTDGFTATMITTIEKHLENKGQILVFMNRRGYAPVYICPSCGLIVDCKHCAAHMTLHRETQKLHCHHCEATTNIPKKCEHCNQEPLIPLGFGTERLEETLNKLFPNTTAIRIDQDSTKNKNAMHKILQIIHSDQCQILVGTQMLAKGHHFPNVTLVAILNIDSGLFSSDFRASEHLAQLITQVAGRAGREEKPGEVFIQTYNPKNPTLQRLITKGYNDFADYYLQEREQASLPPFAHAAIIRAETKDKKKLMDFLRGIRTEGENFSKKKIKIQGPVTASLEKKAGFYRAQLLLQSKNRTPLHNLIEHLINHIATLKTNSTIKWSLDVDPVEL